MRDNLNKLFFSMGRRTRNRELVSMILIIMAGLAALSRAHGSAAYLPSIGPTPLRFETTTPGIFLAWKPLLLPATLPMQNTTADAMTAKTLGADTNTTVSTAVSPPVTGTNPPINTVASLAADQGEKINPETFPPPVLLGGKPDDSSAPVTAQILTDYFKPGPGGGNNRMSTAVFVPVGISSAPPPPKPANTSKVVYKTE